MVKINRARLAKTDYSMEEWETTVSEHEKGMVLALYDFENMQEFIERYHSSFKRVKEQAVKNAGKEGR